MGNFACRVLCALAFRQRKKYLDIDEPSNFLMLDFTSKNLKIQQNLREIHSTSISNTGRERKILSFPKESKFTLRCFAEEKKYHSVPAPNALSRFNQDVHRDIQTDMKDVLSGYLSLEKWDTKLRWREISAKLLVPTFPKGKESKQ